MCAGEVWFSTARGRLVLGAGTVLVAAALVLPMLTLGRAMSSAGPAPASHDQFGAVGTGAPISAVLRLDAPAGSGSVSATLLDRASPDTYRPTTQRRQLSRACDFHVVMGTAADFAPGGIVEISGLRAAGDAITVEQAVVLTRVVRVQQ